MLRSLHVEHYALIDSLDIAFPEGLVIITGQTGAGKSILLGALSLLTGCKADASAIAAGAQTCVVEAEFQVDDPALRAILEEADCEWNGGNLLIRRTVSVSGRSRSFLNDNPVSVQLLQDISSHIVDIHGQHQSLMLSDRRYQMRLLDLYAGNSDLLGSVSALWRELSVLRSQRKELSSRLSSLEADRDYNQARFDRLDRARLRAGELEELEEEQKRLSNAEEIKTDFAVASQSFTPPDGSSGISEALREARKALEKAAKYVPQAAELARRVESARLEIEDIESETVAIGDGICLSEQRLLEVEERMSLLYELFRTFGCTNESELIEARERYGKALFDSTELEAGLRGVETRIAECEKSFKEACSKLGASRRKAAPSFSKSIEESVRNLELDNAVFEVRLESCEPAESGADAVSFLFGSTGSDPVDVAKCASGGEISRIMLCLKAMMARFAGMPTLIFDEIDTGVSGSAADKMGSMICSMGDNMQVFAITHLPQVASKGKAHYLVSKVSSEGRAVSGIRKLDDSERVGEIARLLSGSVITREALANAKSLLD